MSLPITYEGVILSERATSLWHGTSPNIEIFLFIIQPSLELNAFYFLLSFIPTISPSPPPPPPAPPLPVRRFFSSSRAFRLRHCDNSESKPELCSSLRRVRNRNSTETSHYTNSCQFCLLCQVEVWSIARVLSPSFSKLE